MHTETDYEIQLTENGEIDVQYYMDRAAAERSEALVAMISKVFSLIPTKLSFERRESLDQVYSC